MRGENLFFGLFRRKKKEELKPISLANYGQQDMYGGDREMNLFKDQNLSANTDLKPGALQQQGDYNRDIELVLSKLDNIKASLENISRRLEALERSSYGQQTPNYEQLRKRW